MSHFGDGIRREAPTFNGSLYSEHSSDSGSGITYNLADKARRLGIPVWRFTEEGVKAPFPCRGVLVRRARRSFFSDTYERLTLGCIA